MLFASKKAGRAPDWPRKNWRSLSDGAGGRSAPGGIALVLAEPDGARYQHSLARKRFWNRACPGIFEIGCDC